MQTHYEPASWEQFRELWRSLGIAFVGDADETFSKLEKAYSDPRRKYHTLEHIGRGLSIIADMEAVERSRGSEFDAATWGAIRWAWWYHDFVNDGDPNDELQSAHEAGLDAAEVGLPRTFTQIVEQLILATRHDRIPLRYDCAIICDVDLSIFAAPREEFERYEANVREEWAHVPEKLYREARATILNRFRVRPWIYMTDYGRERWNLTARTNLTESIAKLRGG